MDTTRTHAAPFVWTPRQPIDENGFQAVKGRLPARDDGLNRWFLFRNTFSLERVPANVPLDITVDGRYIVYVNGAQAGRGPVRCSPLAQRYDSYDIAAHLVQGVNVVAVLLHTYGVDTAFHETVKGMWAPTFGEGGLWVDGPLLSTRDRWRCTQSAAWDSNTPRVNHSLGFVESFDANLLPARWNDADFDDSGWDEARVLVARGGGPESIYGGLVVRPFPILMPRQIPHLDEVAMQARKVVWSRGQVANPALPIERRMYEEALVPLAIGMASGLDGLLRDGNGAAATVFTSSKADTAFTLDFGRVLTGYPCFEIVAYGGEMIEIACSERLPGEWEAGGMQPDARITPFRVLGNDAHLCRYVARPGTQRFERFEWCAIRYMHVVVRNAPKGLTIGRLGATATNYPVTERGSFACSDPLLTKLWSLGAYTLRQCMHDAWEDCPSREQRQWLGDVTVENLASWAAFGDSAAPLTAKFLIQVAESQRPDGLTQMFAPGDHFENGNLIPDWTLQWILCAHDYWNLSADLTTIDIIWPSIQKALAWFERLCGPNGLVDDMPYWHFIDWAGVGRQGEAAALNAQYAGALRAASALARVVGFGRAAMVYLAKADGIIAALEARHWDERRGAWVDMVDPASGVQQARVSQHGNAAIALWGEPAAGRVDRAFDRITDPGRETSTPAPPVVPFGAALDEEHGVVMANTFYGHFVGEALARHGRIDAALAQIRRRYGAMVEQGATTLWEARSSWASLCHGFSASPTYFLSRYILGVSPGAPGFERIRVSPDIGDLQCAQGVVPAGVHEVSVYMERQGTGFVAWIDGAPNIDIVAAPTWRIARHQQIEGRDIVQFEPAP
ncbi:MAG: hypothetical protein V4857_08485 [Pseudomonadota bacterium]